MFVFTPGRKGCCNNSKGARTRAITGSIVAALVAIGAALFGRVMKDGQPLSWDNFPWWPVGIGVGVVIAAVVVAVIQWRSKQEGK
jgi:protein-S-isoprenylcysteine O-methyltransferase Ste14